jgi:hypothetical protein
VYVHVITEPIELFDANGRPTGVFLVSANHDTRPVEVDQFERTSALVGLRMPDGSLVNAVLSGPATVEVDLASLGDRQPNGLEEVLTELVAMNLSGGGLTLRAGRVFGLPPSQGAIEEKQAIRTGRLDLPGPDAPFCTSPVPADCQGTQAESFFDVFFEVELPGGQVVHNQKALRMQALIDRKPPQAVYVHVITEPIELFDANGRPTGVFLVSANHDTRPPEVERDRFPLSLARLTVALTTGQTISATVSGPAEVDVHFEGGAEGTANDDDGNGRDEVRTELVAMSLTGFSPDLGEMQVSLRDPAKSPFKRSTGLIEETANSQPGRLDLPPFAPTGSADSYFDVYFEIRLPRLGLVLHNEQPKRMRTRITHKPPGPNETYEDPEVIELFDERNVATGLRLLRAGHVPQPQEIDRFPFSIGLLTFEAPDGQTLPVKVSGPTVVEVPIPPKGWATDANQNGLDQVATIMTTMRLTGDSPLGPVVVELDGTGTGWIEEVENTTSGVLDVPPFGRGQARSAFDLPIKILLGGQTFKLAKLLHVESVIHFKPPRPRDRYVNPFTEAIDIVDAASGQPTGYKLVKEIHIPNPGLDITVRPSDRRLVLQVVDPARTGLIVEFTDNLERPVWQRLEISGTATDEGGPVDQILELIGPRRYFRVVEPQAPSP